MIRFASIFVALGLAAAGSTAFAASAKPEPVLMTDAQMDDVAAGVLTIVFQDSFNDWNIDFGGSKGGSASKSVPANSHAKGLEQGKGNPHSSANASSGTSLSKHSNTMLFQVNIVSNVNAAIAGGDATAGQAVGTQTFTTSLTT